MAECFDCGGICVRICEQCCGGNQLSMSTSQPNPSVNQSVGGNCGGASCVQATLNAVGKWGTALTGILTGRPVQTTQSGVAVGARNSAGFRQSSSGGIIFIVILVVVVFFLIKKG